MSPFHDITATLRKTVPADAAAGDAAIAVRSGLARLLHSDDWSADDWHLVDRLSNKLDTTGRLYESYSPQWSKVSTTEIGEPWRAVFALVLCRAFYSQLGKDPGNPMLLKRLNAACKAIDYLDTIAPDAANEIDAALRTIDFEFAGEQVDTTPIDTSTATSGSRTILPLTVLFSEGPIARAYLETIASLGLQPRKIVHLVSSVDVATGKESLRWLPAMLRTPVAAGMQRSRMFHWPATLAKRFPNEVAAIIRGVSDAFGFDEGTVRQAQANKPLVAYSPSVDTLLVKNLKDPALLDYVKNESAREFLFTGGGIVPRTLLDESGSRFIHVHPGFLPAIRGADGLLWSVLTAGRPSASAFYMAPGIDTGDVLIARWLPGITVPIDAGIDIRNRYRMAYAFIDPWVRCCVLRELIANHGEFGNIPASKQHDGRTYHFMHDRLRARAFEKLYTGK